MKQIEFNIIGEINQRGELMIANKGQMKEFFTNNKGAKVIMKASVIQSRGSKAIIGYYNKAIVPDFQRIFREVEGERLTLGETDLRLREMSHVMVEEIPAEEANGFKLVRLKSVYECSNIELVEFIDQLRSIAGKEYDYFIEDPQKEYYKQSK